MYPIEIRKYPEQNVLLIRTQDSLYAMGKYIGQLHKKSKSLGLKVAGKVFCIYYEKPENPQNVDYEMGLPVDQKRDETVTMGGEDCVYLRIKGSYKQFGDAYQAMSDYIEKKNITLSGPPREVYVRGPLLGFLTFIPIMITDIYFPIKKEK